MFDVGGMKLKSMNSFCKTFLFFFKAWKAYGVSSLIGDIPTLADALFSWRNGFNSSFCVLSKKDFEILHESIYTYRIQFAEIFCVETFTKREWKVVFNDPPEPTEYVIPFLMKKWIFVFLDFHHLLPAWMIFL
jgi:hypothetical protein